MFICFVVEATFIRAYQKQLNTYQDLIQKLYQHGVEKTANYYKDDGWQVKANIDNWDTPESILGHIPDIIAKKGKDTVIIQINTCISLLDRMYQESTLEAYAQRTQNTRYILLIVNRDMTIKTEKEFNEKYLG